MSYSVNPAAAAAAAPSRLPVSPRGPDAIRSNAPWTKAAPARLSLRLGLLSTLALLALAVPPAHAAEFPSEPASPAGDDAVAAARRVLAEAPARVVLPGEDLLPRRPGVEVAKRPKVLPVIDTALPPSAMPVPPGDSSRAAPPRPPEPRRLKAGLPAATPVAATAALPQPAVAPPPVAERPAAAPDRRQTLPPATAALPPAARPAAPLPPPSLQAESVHRAAPPAPRGAAPARSVAPARPPVVTAERPPVSSPPPRAEQRAAAAAGAPAVTWPIQPGTGPGLESLESIMAEAPAALTTPASGRIDAVPAPGELDDPRAAPRRAATGPAAGAVPPLAPPGGEVLAQATLPPMPAAPRAGPGLQPPWAAAPAQPTLVQPAVPAAVAPRPAAILPPARPPLGRGLLAQAEPALPTVVQPPVPAQPATPAGPVPLMVEPGAGRLVQLPAPAFTVMAADPRVLRVQPASPTSLFVMGVTPGRTNIIATAEDGTPVVEYEVTVQGGPPPAAAPLPSTNVPFVDGRGQINAPAIESMIRRTVRGGDGVRVTTLDQNGIVLTGTVPGALEAQRAEAIARAYLGDDRTVINNMTLLSSIQVNLRVRVAEISRSITRDLGFNWRVLANDGANWLLGLRVGSASGSILNAITGASTSTTTAPGRIGVGFSSGRFDINSVIDALAGDQLITILAEPNLTAQSGEVASFLAGGEFPVPVSASPVNNSIGIEFKQFGVSLAFVPTVLSPDRLNLRVRPEVSQLSDTGAITVPLAQGVVRIPALAVRRAETTVELGSGQSFAIAGLLQRTTNLAGSSLLGLGDLPVIGALFRSDAFRRSETELVIIVTPYLVRPVSDPRAFGTPTDGYRPATDLDRLVYRRQIARGAGVPGTRIRLPADTGFILE